MVTAPSLGGGGELGSHRVRSVGRPLRRPSCLRSPCSAKPGVPCESVGGLKESGLSEEPEARAHSASGIMGATMEEVPGAVPAQKGPQL